jgi:hypothetical protein
MAPTPCSVKMTPATATIAPAPISRLRIMFGRLFSRTAVPSPPERASGRKGSARLREVQRKPGGTVQRWAGLAYARM